MQSSESPDLKHHLLKNHVQDMVALDFFTVPTATFRVLFVLVILAHERRRIVHFNVTEHPTAQWTAQQVLPASPGSLSVGRGTALSLARSRWCL